MSEQRKWVMRALALTALGVSGYLVSVSLAERRLPVGCTAGSGCAEVLGSRWSSWFGIPVSAAAALLYIVVFAATFFIDSQSLRLRRTAWTVLIGSAAAIASAALWFIALQVFVLHAICPWCMADHALGLTLSIFIVWQTPVAWRQSHIKGTPTVEHAARPAGNADGVLSPGRLLASVAVGIVAVELMALTQWLFESPTGRTVRLPPGVNADSGPGPNRRLAVVDGKFELSAHELPVLGSADAPKLLVVLFDYCCPHCRATHGYIMHGMPSFDGELGVLLCPMPMDQKCNRTVHETEPRFEHACELARMALAVWRAEPKAFAAYDQWLFEPESPRDPAEARRKAEELVGASALEAALRDPWIERQLASDVDAYIASGADRIPLLMSPGFASIVGRPESEQELLETLRTELLLDAQR